MTKPYSLNPTPQTKPEDLHARRELRHELAQRHALSRTTNEHAFKEQNHNCQKKKTEMYTSGP